MERDLTTRYPFLFERKKAHKLISFLRDAYRSGKSAELASFVVWELRHRLRLFPSSAYLKFGPGPALCLDNEQLDDPDFNAKIEQLFGSHGLGVRRIGLNWKQMFIDEERNIIGCLYPNDTDLYESRDQGRSIRFLHSFPGRIKGIFVSGRGTIFVCVEGCIYRSSDRGVTFRKALELSSPISTFRFNNGMTETPRGTLIIGEYGNLWEETRWRKLAYLYFSFDQGATWERSDFLMSQGVNKHVHLVRYSKLLDRILVTDGDNRKRLWIVDLPELAAIGDPAWRLVNRLHIQMGGYTAVAENQEELVFGTDYQGGTNFVVGTVDGRKFVQKIVPDPYRRSPIDNMIRRKSKRGSEIWANLPYSTAQSRCLLMNTFDDGRSWNKLLEYRRSAHTVWLISSSADISSEVYFSIEDAKNGSRAVYRVSDS